MTKKQSTILAVLSVLVLVLALLVSRRLWFRLDLTASRAFTISPVSRNLYAEIPEQVRITYYVSDRLRSIHPIPGEVIDLLREYAARSHGRITVAVRDPVRSNMAETVEQLGIAGQPLETVEKDQASVSMVYSGILVEYLDRIEVLPLVFSLDTLEYDLTGRIRAMVRDQTREAGVLTGDAGRDLQRDYAYIYQTMSRAGYRVRNILPGDEIPSSLPVLVVLGGAGELEEWDLYRIDHYIRGGGKALFAVDAVMVDDTGYGMNARAAGDRGLLAMLAFWGAGPETALVLDMACQTIFVQYQLLRYPFWLTVPAQSAAPDHPAAAGFAGADLFWASPLRLSPPEGVEGTALFRSSPEAWLQTQNFFLDPNQSYYFTMEREETAGQKILAASLSGKFPSWFSGREKPVREGSEETLPDLPGRAAESRIVVIGDTDFAVSELIRQTESQRNLDFFIRALDWLGNDDDIISIRGRAPSSGRLEKIADPEKRAAKMAFVRILNVFVIPALVLLLGILACAGRRKILSAGTGNRRHTA